MLLKLRNPGWPPEGAPGSPVSVLMPGHIAPEDGREQGKQAMKEEEEEEDRRRRRRRQGITGDSSKVDSPASSAQGVDFARQHQPRNVR